MCTVEEIKKLARTFERCILEEEVKRRFIHKLHELQLKEIENAIKEAVNQEHDFIKVEMVGSKLCVDIVKGDNWDTKCKDVDITPVAKEVAEWFGLKLEKVLIGKGIALLMWRNEEPITTYIPEDEVPEWSALKYGEGKDIPEDVFKDFLEN